MHLTNDQIGYPNDPKEKTAFQQYLPPWTFKKIGNDSDIEHFLRINHAGRRILEDSDGSTVIEVDLPLSVWPIILERAHEKAYEVYREFGKDPACLYYLLCNGPALFGRPDLGLATLVCKDETGSDDHVKKKDNPLKTENLQRPNRLPRLLHRIAI